MRPQMNKQKVAECMRKGGSRLRCEKAAYPDGMPSKGSKKKGGKKPPMRGGY